MKRGRLRADDVSRSGASRRRQIDATETLREHRSLECARVTRSRAGGSSGPMQPEASGSGSENGRQMEAMSPETLREHRSQRPYRQNLRSWTWLLMLFSLSTAGPDCSHLSGIAVCSAAA